MKKNSFIFVLIFGLLLSGISFAQTETAPTTGAGMPATGAQINRRAQVQDLRAQIEQKREELKMQAEKMRGEAKAKMDALKQKINTEKDQAKAKIQKARVDGRQNALNRFDTIIEGLNRTKERVNDQIKRAETLSIDTTNAKNKVAEAESKIEEIKGKVAEMNTIFAGNTNILSKENKEKIVKLNQETQDMIKNVREMLQEAIKDVRDQIRLKIQSNAPQTPTTNSPSTTQ